MRPADHRRQATPPVMGAAKTISEYQLGDSIGKGAFGTVYQGLNMKTGEVVAIKQITLQNIPKNELDAMMVEIDLLKKLHHTNIVKYLGFVKTKDYLNIILEYCENGSLQSICKKFGKFPETLMAVYIGQVLEGLVYLHQEGVIHRDIKGANILTTKEGHVKLADFGVATHTASNDNAVVGSPYWMAPEVIEMTGGTTASDIWSVGATIIELMTGEPPYYDLSPMSALFRIVQDEHPPLPEGISSWLRDFFMQCFQKDCNLRVSAAKLLKHPWLSKARKERMGNEAAPDSKRMTTFIDTVETIKQWNEALQDSSGKPMRASSILSRQSMSKATAPSAVTAASLGVNKHQSGVMQPRKLSTPGPSPLGVPQLAKPGDTGRFVPMRLQPVESDKDEDNWDADFDDDDSLTEKATVVLVGQRKSSAQSSAPSSASSTKSKASSRPDLAAYQERDDDEDDLDVATIKVAPKIAAVKQSASQHQQQSSITIKASTADHRRAMPRHSQFGARDAAADLSMYAEDNDNDFDDVDIGDDEFKNKVDKVRKNQKGTFRPLLIKPDDVKHLSFNFGDVPSPTSTLTLPPSLQPQAQPSVQRQFMPAKRPVRASSSEISSYREDEFDADDYSEVFGMRVAGADSQSSTLKLRLEVSFPDELEEDEEDPFAGIEDDMPDIDMEEQAQIERRAALVSDMLKLAKSIRPEESEEAIMTACDKLLHLLEESPSLRLDLCQQNGATPILEMLDDIPPNSQTLPQILRLLSQIVSDGGEIFDWFVSVGGAATVIKFAGSTEYPSDVRLRALHLVHSVVFTSAHTLSLLVAARGIPVLVNVLEDPDFSANRALVLLAFECVITSLDTVEHRNNNASGSGMPAVPKAQLLHLYASAGLLPALATAMHHVLMDSNDESTRGDIVDRMCDVFAMFSAASTKSTRSFLVSRPVLKGLVHDLGYLHPALQLKILKVIREVSMLSANALEIIHKVGAIPVLVGLLERKEGPFTQEIRMLDIYILFNLCQVYKARQEAAAIAGIIPHLKYFSSVKNNMKEFAIQLLCDMVDAGKRTRELLWQNNILPFYIELLASGTSFVQHVALRALADWLSEETNKVEPVLMQVGNISKIVNALSAGKFVHATSKANPLEALQKITLVSKPINQAFGQSALVLVLAERLSTADVVVRKTLLQILMSLYSQHPDPASMVAKYPRFRQIVDVLAEAEPERGGLLVREIARKLRDNINA